MEYLGSGNLYTGKLQPLPFKARPESMEKLCAEGFVLFSLGPLYVYAGIDESILERFAGDECTQKAMQDKPVVAGTLHFQHMILARCEAWNSALDVMAKDAFDFFGSWMLAQTFINRQRKAFFVPRRMDAPVLDPLALEHDKRIPIALPLYSVSGLHSVVRPRGFMSHAAAPVCIDLERGPPEPHVIEMGTKMLNLTEGQC